ncbi:Hypothetical_protein [Hexamita inflata]|uniref:Hypothetical_protein n=1 Tax=Hexamita inflata TaxID=28002 RepID=A0AA86NMI1_9EUKA|nr:Hypothetical protein HINF_LOCUS9336 [Hexamita inflata]
MKNVSDLASNDLIKQSGSLNFLLELSSIQVFEAVAYRDLNYLVSQIITNSIQSESKVMNFNKQLMTAFLYESIIIKSGDSQNVDYQKIVELFYIEYKADNITFLYQGTFGSLTNLVRYTPLLRSSSSHRFNVCRSVHSCPSQAPQFHPSKLGYDYYICGIDSNQQKPAESYIKDQRFEVLTLNLFLALSPYSTSHLQSLYSQISPQLLIILTGKMRIRNNVLHSVLKKEAKLYYYNHFLNLIYHNQYILIII